MNCYKALDLMSGENKKSPYIDINPNGTVPTLVHDDLTLTDSMPISTYLADQFGKGTGLVFVLILKYKVCIKYCISDQAEFRGDSDF